MRYFFYTFILFALACNTSATLKTAEVQPVVSEVEEVSDGKPEDATNPSKKVKEVFDETCFDNSAAQPSMICDDVRQPVCGCNKVNYKNPCEATKVGVKYYTWGYCTKTAKTAIK
jgi:hypothetical protein